jgi:hypothetical protein
MMAVLDISRNTARAAADRSRLYFHLASRTRCIAARARGQARWRNGKDVDSGLKSDKPGATTSGSAAADEKRLVRQQKSRALVNAIEPWLRAKLTLISQKRKLAVAIRCALSRWDG